LRAGSGHTCSVFAFVDLPNAYSLQRRSHALQSTAEVRRCQGASSATEHAGVERTEPLLIRAVQVQDMLVVARQL
jgi:hypothetical protein